MLLNKKVSYNIISTFFLQIAACLFMLIHLKYITTFLNSEYIGVYFVSKRFIAILMPLIMLNMSISIARFSSRNQKDSDKYFSYSIIIITCISIFIALFSILFKNSISLFLFGTEIYNPIILPLILFLYAMNFQMLCIGYFRGLSNFSTMNTINIIFHIFSVIIIILINNYSSSSNLKIIKMYFIYHALTTVLINTLIIAKQRKYFFNHFFKKIPTYINNIKELKDKEFFTYGLSRLISTFSLSLILFIPIIFTSHLYSLEEASKIGILIAIFRILQFSIAPISIVLLPVFSKKIKDPNEIRQNCKYVVEMIFLLPMIISMTAYFIGPDFIYLWLGEEYFQIGHFIKYQWIPISLMTVFFIIKTILDGIYVYPYTNIITISSMLLLIFTLFISTILYKNIWTVIFSISISFSLLGILSLLFLVRMQKISIFTKKNIIAIIWIFIIFLIMDNVKSMITNFSFSNILFFKIFILIALTILSVKFHQKVIKYNYLNLK